MQRDDEAAKKHANSQQIGVLSLPLDAIRQIGSFSDTRSTSRFSLACRYTHTALKPSLMIRKANCLLREVMYANPEGLKKLMQHDKPQETEPCIALKKVSAIEACDRPWKAVSPLEFTAWAGDTELVRLLLNYVPQTQLKEALAQLEHLQREGCEHGKPLTAFDALVEVYRNYIKKLDGQSNEEINQAAVMQIGGAQRQLPGVGLQWFCDPEPFEPTPKFDRAPARTYKLVNGFDLMPSPGCLAVGLGSKFFIFKYEPGAAASGVGTGSVVGRRVVAAISQLCEVRRTELGAIIQQLRTTPLASQCQIV